MGGSGHALAPCTSTLTNCLMPAQMHAEIPLLCAHPSSDSTLQLAIEYSEGLASSHSRPTSTGTVHGTSASWHFLEKSTIPAARPLLLTPQTLTHRDSSNLTAHFPEYCQKLCSPILLAKWLSTPSIADPSIPSTLPPRSRFHGSTHPPFVVHGACPVEQFSRESQHSTGTRSFKIFGRKNRAMFS